MDLKHNLSMVFLSEIRFAQRLVGCWRLGWLQAFCWKQNRNFSDDGDEAYSLVVNGRSGLVNESFIIGYIAGFIQEPKTAKTSCVKLLSLYQTLAPHMKVCVFNTIWNQNFVTTFLIYYSVIWWFVGAFVTVVK